MIGETYLERGRPVKVLLAWQGPARSESLAAKVERYKRKRKGLPPEVVFLGNSAKGSGPRNVLIQREDGTLVVRPFRGLRRAKESA